MYSLRVGDSKEHGFYFVRLTNDKKRMGKQKQKKLQRFVLKAHKFQGGSQKLVGQLSVGSFSTDPGWFAVIKVFAGGFLHFRVNCQEN